MTSLLLRLLSTPPHHHLPTTDSLVRVYLTFQYAMYALLHIDPLPHQLWWLLQSSTALPAHNELRLHQSCIAALTAAATLSGIPWVC